jgi:hypothetical protein
MTMISGLHRAFCCIFFFLFVSFQFDKSGTESVSMHKDEVSAKLAFLLSVSSSLEQIGL